MPLIATQSKHQIHTQELAQTVLKLDSTITANALYPLFEAGVRGGSIINAITITTDDALARTILFSEKIGSLSFPKTRVSLPISTPYGTDGTNPELDVLSQFKGTRIDGSGNRTFFLAPGKLLEVSLSVIPAATKFVIVRVYGEHY